MSRQSKMEDKFFEFKTEMFADALSDVESDVEGGNGISDDSDSDSDDLFSTVHRKKKHTCTLPSDSDSTDSARDIPITNGTSVWSKQDKTPILENFIGNSGVKQYLANYSSINEVVNLFFGNDFFKMLSHETNLYQYQNESKWKEQPRTVKWVDVEKEEIKKFLAIVILMAHVKKDHIRDYWSTDPFLETPIFSKLMSRNRFEQILQSLHFNNNALQNNSEDRLFKIRPVVNYLKKKFQLIYKPNQEISLHEAIIPWRGRLRFRTYNPDKIVKYGILIRVVCESTTGYIGNIELYSGQGRKLEETILSALEPYFDQWYHVYQDNYYNSVKIAEDLLKKKVRVCGTIRVKWDLPSDLKSEELRLKRNEMTFRRKGEILLLSWKNKRLVRMISTIHDASTVKKTYRNGTIKTKPVCIDKYNAFLKGVDRADQYLSYYSILRKTTKWSTKVVFWMINCGLFNSYTVYKKLNPTAKIKYKVFLLEIAKTWASDDSEAKEDVAEGAKLGPSTATRRAPYHDPPGRLSGNMRLHVPEKIVSKGKQKYPCRRCRVCTANNKRSDTRYICKFCLVPLHHGTCFQTYHTKKQYWK